ncbi:MAG TPA: ring-hydroxylating oxygenase subunit alpha, partial [Gammaproteobacteria bacterium]|nr:ring-hydroxylating oxygenase subunit alpha [Gammaproteobacteria bacterium]
MLTAAENKTLTETGFETPMGEVFRCYWTPALLSRELPTPNSGPVRLKLLGEDFIAFRDSNGEIGIVDARCPHRNANLFFGRNENCGLRCVYHGWKFDVHGNCVDIPNASTEVASRLKPNAGIRALQVREWGDVIWAFLGDGEAPELPQFEFAKVPSSHRFVSKKFQQCNWAQACEGGLDTAHFSFLHAGINGGEKVGLHHVGKSKEEIEGHNEPTRLARFRWMIEDGEPRFTVLEHAAGMLLCAARTADNDDVYYRMTQFLMPNHSLAPGNFPEDNNLGNTWVPIDDTSCWIFCYCWNPDRPLTEGECRQLASGSGIFAEVDDHYIPIRQRENDYLVDRDAQRTESYTGIRGISEQDAAIADSQGPIADRTKEMLVQTDLGVVRFRQTMFDATASVASGADPLGVDRPDAYFVRSGDSVASPESKLEDVVSA